MMFKPLTPRLRQMPAHKSAVLSVLDVGASKIVCLIARLTPLERSDSSSGRTHRCKVLGVGHQRSRGVKAGAIVDLDAAENAIRLAVDAAERMSSVEIESVIVNLSGGRLSSRLFAAKIATQGKAVGEYEVHRVLEAASAASACEGRAVLHAVPTGYRLDAQRGIHDPKGMV
ncbi:MAG: cell division protein FtsA, partial [Roseiarcus sp.]